MLNDYTVNKKGIGLIASIAIGASAFIPFGEPTLNERMAIIQMQNYEISQMTDLVDGKVLLTDPLGVKVLPSLNKKILARKVKPSEEQVLGVKVAEYERARELLLNKAEKKSLLDRIINN